jgi:hypothetical protein
MRHLPVFALVLLLACACAPLTGGAGDGQLTPLPPPDPGQGLSTLAGQIQEHPEGYEGQSVTLVGYFRGPDILDEVKPGVPPTDRFRDWALKDDSGAIYVAASDKLPFAPTSQEIWRILRVRGTVAIHSSNMPYIVPDEIEWEGLKENYAVLPAYCLIAIHRFGGANQLDHHIYIYDNRNLVVYDSKTEWHGTAKLKRSELDDLQSTLTKAGFYDLPDTVGEACQGCIRYRVAAVDEKQGRAHFVTLYEGSVPAKLGAYIERAIERSEDAKPM